MIEEKTSTTEEFCMEFLATCRGLHTQHGLLPGYDIALQVYKKGEAIAYSNLPSVGRRITIHKQEISGGRVVVFSAKARHVAKARAALLGER
ncbi:hypothetical protein PPROV_001124100 [Pycnococcus provasolii]|uniref:Uncharacterized protein n=1 Tax=Pycnococcus provasolii TaxID=41880 RepID=A0A830I0C3_9CHLO|nr:hypothetical protein PPROV_001124100 [Pycnococcus provasolii]